jgi:cob(I)alamin adenosyltransferase
MMKIYTRTGDQGETGVIGGRVRKDDPRVEAYGTVDELNCFIGLSISYMDQESFSDMREDLISIQHALFDCGADLAMLRQETDKYKMNDAAVEELERWIDRYDADAPEITRFILPGGTQLSSSFHVCRTVCRRAERRVVTLSFEQEINESVRRYLNRLSDLLFTLARSANARAGLSDIEYMRGREVFKKS